MNIKKKDRQVNNDAQVVYFTVTLISIKNNCNDKIIPVAC